MVSDVLSIFLFLSNDGYMDLNGFCRIKNIIEKKDKNPTLLAYKVPISHVV